MAWTNRNTYIIEHSNVHRVFDAIKDIYFDLINKPEVNQYGKLSSDSFCEADLNVANELLRTLEALYNLRVGREGSSPTSHGVATEQMFKDYLQMKHWQKMLNAIYGPQEAPGE